MEGTMEWSTGWYSRNLWGKEGLSFQGGRLPGRLLVCYASRQSVTVTFFEVAMYPSGALLVSSHERQYFYFKIDNSKLIEDDVSILLHCCMISIPSKLTSAAWPSGLGITYMNSSFLPKYKINCKGLFNLVSRSQTVVSEKQ